MPRLEELQEIFDEMMAEYRTQPELEGHQILSTQERDGELIVQVRSNRGNDYEVRIGNQIKCTCQGYRNWGRCKHILFVIKQIINGNLVLPEAIQGEQVIENIERYLRSYSHRTVTIPLLGELYGIEIEIAFKSEVGLNVVTPHLRQLFRCGLVAETDSSLPYDRGVELKSAILGSQPALKLVSSEYWIQAAEWQDVQYERQGNHIHVAADSFFDTTKRAATSTLKLLFEVAKKMESKIDFRKVFGRRPNQYCKLCRDSYWDDRYNWVNFTNLRRYEGKTIEIRGFKTNPLRLPENLFRAKYIANLFFRSLLAWREAGKPDPEEWVRETNLFSLLTDKAERYFTVLALGFREFPERKKKIIIEKGITYALPVYAV
jgi:hypothetical protein